MLYNKLKTIAIAIGSLFIGFNSNAQILDAVGILTEVRGYKDYDGDGYAPFNAEECTIWNDNLDTNCVPRAMPYDIDDSNPHLSPNTLYYLDADFDGYYTTTIQWNETMPVRGPEGSGYTYVGGPGVGGIGTWEPLGIDCNDADRNITSPGQTTWYLDQDGDGYPSNSQGGCTRPGEHWYYERYYLGGGKIWQKYGDSDCDDQNTRIHSTRTLYQDNDGDGYHNGTTITVCDLTTPIGYTDKDLGVDCDDNDASVYRTGEFYQDKDGDNHLVGPFTLCYGAETPAGYTTDALLCCYPIDCNDDDAQQYKSRDFFVDNDGDFYVESETPVTVCGGSIFFNPTGYVSEDYRYLGVIDCDDNNASIGGSRTYYRDNDGDHFTTDTIQDCSGSAPAGYISYSFGIDCDDNNASAYRTASAYVDNDGDHYTVGAPTNVCAGGGATPGFSSFSLGEDCDDNNVLKYETTTYWVDADGDRYTSGTTSVCTSPQEAIPAGLININVGEDCDDSDDTKNKIVTSYIDMDGDNIRGDDTPVNACGIPANHTSLYTSWVDCDDNSPDFGSIQVYSYYYVDNDGDGFGTGNSIRFTCTPEAPAGYALKGDDCDDTDPNVHPNTKWYLDVDNDNYRRNDFFFTQCERPTGGNYKSEGELLSQLKDCNDGNASIGAPQKWYRDQDQDGYGTGVSVNQCNRPTHYYDISLFTDTIGDCKDTDPSVNPGTGGEAVWYRDVDGDGFGIPTDSVVDCVQPSGYVANKTDCDDGNTSIRNIRWYLDEDDDGYYSGTFVDACSQPSADYKLIGDLTSSHIDCFDDDPLRIPNTCSTTDYSLPLRLWSLDADNDGYTESGYPGSAVFKRCVTDCRYVPELLSRGDCDDSNDEITPNTYWYKDTDGDGYGTGQRVKRCAQPTGYDLLSNMNAATGDCDDSDNTVFPGSPNGKDRWFRDADRDGYGDGAVVKITCNQPSGYVADSTDCNDANAAINPASDWYKDTDGDLYGDGTVLTQCAQPTDHFLEADLADAFTDCNDADSTVNPLKVWYKDADNDDYSDGTTQVSCTQPINYKDASALIGLSTDCDDDDAGINPTTLWYKDSDNDGYGTGDTKTACVQPIGHYMSSALTATTGDCNDGDATINPTTKWYADTDDDNYGDGTSQVQCDRPVGYKLFAELTDTIGDCDETSAELLPSTKWYQDLDGDGAGNPATAQTSCIKPNTLAANDFVLNGEDCDDTDSLESPNQTWYADLDDDGYSSGVSRIQCERPNGYKHSSELVATSGDCADDDALVNPATIWYQDVDADGYSNGVSLTQCAQPTDYQHDANLIANSGDCDDNDASLNPATLWYADTDVDGLGDPNNTTASCTQPAGFVANSDDCNDGDNGIGTLTWYKDIDNDDYSDGANINQCAQPTGYQLPADLTSTTGDCDDNDATKNPAAVWHLDADKDGYGEGTSTIQCAQPDNYALATDLTATTGDCNDADAVLNPATVWYKDVDGDGYSDGTTQVSCTQPSNYYLASSLTALSGDCDDNDVVINPATVWYKDADGDGYSDGLVIVQCTQPTDHYLATALTATSGDCNDGDSFFNPTTTWHKDLDGDDYSDGSTLNQCNQPVGYELSTNLTATTGDCDDNNAEIEPTTVWHLDTDGDGYGTGVQMIQCARPADHYLVSEMTATTGDCDDNNAAFNPASVWYHDNDGDGYGNGITIVQCTQPADHFLETMLISPSGDCDDNDNLIFPSTVWFKDADGDGYGSGDSLVSCTQPVDHFLAGNLTDPYSDCDDDNINVNPTTVWHQDTDGDGHGVGVTLNQCAQPVGYVLVSDLTDLADDCDDNNALAIDPSQTWYEDQDGDGVGTGNSLTQCMQPTGYNTMANLSATSGDCDDNNATLNISAPEVTISSSQPGCANSSSVTFTATPATPGSYNYLWTLNGNPVGTNANTYDNASLNDADRIGVTLIQPGFFCNTTDELAQGVYPVVSISAEDTCVGKSELMVEIDPSSTPTAIDWLNGTTTEYQSLPLESTNARSLFNNGSNFTYSYGVVSHNSNLNLSQGGELTIEAWVKPYGNQLKNILMKGSYGYGLAIDGTKLLFWDQSNKNTAVKSDGNVTLNQWQHIAVTVVDEGSSLSVKFYINGVLVGDKTSSQTAIRDNTTSLYISREGPSAFRPYFGNLDEVRLWNTALTGDQINAQKFIDIDASNDLYDHLVVDYRINESSGFTLNDSRNGFNAQLFGSVFWRSIGAPSQLEMSYLAENTGAYTASVTNISGCTTQSNTVEVAPEPTWYLDADGDGYGTGVSKDSCDQPENYYLPADLVSTTGDCDDANGAAHDYSSPVTITSDQPGCSSGLVTFTATPNTPGNHSYQWSVEGSTVGTNANTYSNGNLTSGNAISVIQSEEGFCDSYDTLIQLVNPVANLITNDNCLGASVLEIDSTTEITDIVWRNNGTDVYTSLSGAAGPEQLFTGSSFLGIAVDNAGAVFVTDGSDIKKYAPGAQTGVTYTNNVNAPRGLFIDDQDNLYVADWLNHRIQKFAPGDATGVTVAGGNGQGSAANQLDEPRAVWKNDNGDLFIIPSSGKDIIKWTEGDATGSVIFNNGIGFLSEIFGASNGIDAFLPSYNPFVVMTVTPDGTSTTLAGTGGQGSAANQFGPINDAVMDEEGNFYVSDAGNQRLQYFESGSSTGETLLSSWDGIYLYYKNGVLYYTSPNGVYRFVNGIESQYTPQTTGNYTAYITNSFGCSVTTNSVEVTPKPRWYQDADGDGYGTGVSKDTCAQPTDYYLASSLTDTIGDCDDSDATKHIVGPAVSVSSDQGACATGEVTFTATPTVPGTYTYQWLLNGSAVGTNSNTYSNNALTNTNSIQVIVSQAGYCDAPSNIIEQSMAPAITLSTSDICQDSALLTLDNVSNLQSIEWRVNNQVEELLTKAASPSFDLLYSASNGVTLDGPDALWVDANDNVYIVEQNNHRVLKFAPGSNVPEVVAGSASGTSGSDLSSLNNPSYIFMNAAGDMFILDNGNARVVKWAAGATQGEIVAGGNGYGFATNQLRGFSATTIWVDNADAVYIGNGQNIMKWDAGATDGTIVRSMPTDDLVFVTQDFDGDFISGSYSNNPPFKIFANGDTTNYLSEFNGVTDLKIDEEGNLYVLNAFLPRAIYKYNRGEITPSDTINISPWGSGFFVKDNGETIYLADGISDAVYKYSNLLSNKHLPQQSGNYAAFVTNTNGCSTLSNAVELFDGPELAVIVEKESLCDGESTTLTATGASSYTWSNGITNGTSFTPDSTTTFDLVAASAMGCTSTLDETITVYSIPEVDITTSFATSDICQEDSISITGNNAGLTYTFPVGISNGAPFLVPGTDTNLVVAVESADGCFADTTLSLAVHTKPDVSIDLTEGNTSICVGDSITLSGMGANSYQWSGGITNGVSFMPSDSGFYSVIGSDANGCYDSDSIFIRVSQGFTLDIQSFPASEVVCSGSTAQLTATGGNQYTWNKSVVNGEEFTPSVTDTYTVIALDTVSGCSVTDSVTLTITGGAASANTIMVSECSSYVFFGDTLTSSGTYEKIISNTMGCDSTITLELTILEPTDTAFAAHAFANYSFNGTLLTASGIYYDTLDNNINCDSIIRLDLTLYSTAGDTDEDGTIDGTEIAGDLNSDGIINLPELAGDINGDGVLNNGELLGDVNGDGIINNGEIIGDQNGTKTIIFPEIAGDSDGDNNVSGNEITGDIDGDEVIGPGEVSGDVNGNGVIDADELSGDVNGDLVITAGEIVGDEDGDGVIGPLEIAGDLDGNGTIDNDEISGDVNGNGVIESGEIAGDINGDGQITAPDEVVGDVNGNGIINGNEFAGDTDGNGSMSGDEIAGDTNADGVISGGEIAGDLNNNGVIDAGEVTGDINGDGIANVPLEISGDVNGNGIIDAGEVIGDVNGNGTLDIGEIAGDLNGNQVIDQGEIGGDLDGNGTIDGGELLGDLNGNGVIDGVEIVGDINGNGVIDRDEFTGDQNNNGVIDPGEIVGDFDGNGTIDGTEVSGDINGDGTINNVEISGDLNGNGEIDGTEIPGDVNGNGTIDGTEIIGDLNGNNMGDSTEIIGDVNGNGFIDHPTELTGDVNGNGVIDAPVELLGDVNGNGIIDGIEISGNANGNGVIDNGEFTGDVNANGTVDLGEIVGDVNGNGSIDGDEIAGDINGDGVIGPNELSGDINGNGTIDPGEVIGDINGDGTLGTDEIAGDVNGDGTITTTEVTGDLDGDGTINGGEIMFDINGNGTIDPGEIVGDVNGDGVIGFTEIAGDNDGNGIINGGEINGDINGDGSITPPEFAGDINGNGTLDSNEVVGDGGGDGVINNTEVAGDVNNDGVLGTDEIPGDQNNNGIIDGIEILGDVNNDGMIDTNEIAGDANGNGVIDGGELAGDINGNGTFDLGEIPGDVDGNGSINDLEIAGDINGDFTTIGNNELAGDLNNDGVISGLELAGDLNGNGTIDTLEVAGDVNGNGIIDAPDEIGGDVNGDGILNNGELPGDINGDNTINRPDEIVGDVNGNGLIDLTEIAGDVNGNGTIDGGEIAGDEDGNGTIGRDEIAGNLDGDGIIYDDEVVGDVNGNGVIDNGEILGDVNGNGTIDTGGKGGGELAGDFNNDGKIGCDDLELQGTPLNLSVTNDNFEITVNPAGLKYIWVDCDNDLVLDTISNPFIADSAGNYQGYVIEQGCVVSTGCQNLSLVNGIDGITNKSIKIFPNPSTGRFNVELSESATITVLDAKAIVVYEGGRDTNGVVDLSFLPNGLYYMSLAFEDGEVIYRKIIIQN